MRYFNTQYYHRIRFACLLGIVVFALGPTDVSAQTVLRNGTFAIAGSMGNSGTQFSLAVAQPLAGNGGQMQSGFFPAISDVFTPVAIEEAPEAPNEAEIPKQHRLDQNYPNPFNPSTSITYELGGTSVVELTVFDILGRRIAVLVDRIQSAGSYQVTFSTSGEPTGIYLYRLKAGNQVFTRRMILLK